MTRIAISTILSGLLLAILSMSILSCAQEESVPDRKRASNATISFRAVSSAKSGVTFKNVVDEVYGRNALLYDYFYNGGGVALADFDQDGLTDIFFCGNDSPNQVYRNNGSLKFTDESEGLPQVEKWTFGVTTADINNDGKLDLYLSNSGPDNDPEKLRNQLLINNGDFTFTDMAKGFGLDLDNYSMQAEFFDMDNDGDLDLWINAHARTNEVDRLIAKYGLDDIRKGNLLDNLNALNETAISKAKIRLFRNDRGKFVDISKAAGVNLLAFGLGLSIADFNNDGFLDAYVANDYYIPDYLFINNKNGGFVNNLEGLNHIAYYSMGSDANDYNNDGILDLVVVDMTPKDHYRNKTLMESMDVRKFNVFTENYNFPRSYMFNVFQVGVGNGYFSEIGNALEASLTDWSWAPLLFDMDNDGRKDLYITNGYLRDTKNQDYRTHQDSLRRTLGQNYTHDMALAMHLENTSNPVQNSVFRTEVDFSLTEVTNSASGLGKSFSNGAAYGDLDNDGDLDLVINNLNAEASILENNTGGNYLQVLLKAKNGAINRHAELYLHTKEGVQRQDYTTTRGYLSCMEPGAHFGLDAATQVDSVIIEWLNGRRAVLTGVEANQKLVVDYDVVEKYGKKKSKTGAYFVDVSPLLQRAGIKHVETFHNDFDFETLLPQKYSSLGPALAVADINKDGMTDFYLGGSQGHAGRLMLMGQSNFTEIGTSQFAQDASFEDIGAVFFDANGDELMDLYVASGGGSEVQTKDLQDRLYLNQNNQSFRRAINALPPMRSSTKSVTPFDFDNDGDLDLFVGGRNAPGNYPHKAQSYLLINTAGTFQNLEIPAFYEQLPNMVTDATIIDFNGDQWKDLVVVGEWTEPKVFINNNGKNLEFRPVAGLEDLKGWWYSIRQADFNNDGKVDFALGNLGINNKFHASISNPLRVYYGDFDANGRQDIFLAKNYKSKLVPVRGKECSSEQLPILNEKFKSYDAFASASLEEVLGKENLQKGQSLEVTTFSSMILLNTGDGFQPVNLPFEAQWAPILDMEIVDFNRDGNADILAVGNIFNTEPETPSYDAGKGLILFGRGDGSFQTDIDIRKTGINFNKNTKAVAVLLRQNSFGLLGANNNDSPQLFVRN